MADLFGFPREETAGVARRWWDSLKIFFGGSPDLAARLAMRLPA